MFSYITSTKTTEHRGICMSYCRQMNKEWMKSCPYPGFCLCAAACRSLCLGRGCRWSIPAARRAAGARSQSSPHEPGKTEAGRCQPGHRKQNYLQKGPTLNMKAKSIHLKCWIIPLNSQQQKPWSNQIVFYVSALILTESLQLTEITDRGNKHDLNYVKSPVWGFSCCQWNSVWIKGQTLVCYLDIDKQVQKISGGHDNGGVEGDDVALVQTQIQVGGQPLREETNI